MAPKMLERLRCDADVASTDRARISLQMSSVLKIYTVDFRSRVFRKKKTPIVCVQSRFPPLPPISMLLPTVLPAVVEIRTDAVSRVYVNIDIGGKGGIRPVIHV